MRRLGVSLTAAAIAFSAVLMLPTGATGATESDDGNAAGSHVSVTRYGGADRYATSLQIAEAFAVNAGGSLEWVVLVSGERWTDAVVAAPFAGARNAPVLMTPPDGLRDDAREFLKRVGVTTAVIIGPEAGGGAHGPGRGIDQSVLGDLAAEGIRHQRVDGVDRYHTSRVAAARYAPGRMGDLGSTAIVASGEVFADALVAGPFAARGNHPVLLTPADELYPAVAGYLLSVGIEHVVLMGGTAALSDAVEQSIKDLDIAVTRLAGATRFDTAVMAAEFVTGRYSDPSSHSSSGTGGASAGITTGGQCFANSTIGLARAHVPFDSFSAAPLLAQLCAPLVLADPGRIPSDTAAYLDAARGANSATDLRVFGGDAAVSQAAIDSYLAGEAPAEGESDPDDLQAGEDEADDTAGDAGTAPEVLPPGTCGGSIDDEPSQFIPHRNAEDAAWSPDCSQFVYTQDGAIWLMNNDGTNRRRLVPYDGGYKAYAVWSPQGDRIAFTRGFNDGGHWVSHIWTVNVDGSHNNQRTDGDVIDRWPTWSPDGKKIAYERMTGSGRDADGNRLDSDRHIVVMTSYGNKPKALNPGGSWEHSPAWSPDGTQLAYVSGGALWLSDAQGDNAQRIVLDVFFNGGLSWSPDGKRLAFVRPGNETEQIIISDTDGLNERVVFAFPGHLRTPRWSPDGQRLAFHTIGKDSSHVIYVGGARGEPEPPPTGCGPDDFKDLIPAFNHHYSASAATGTRRIAVLFVDFADKPATHTTREEDSGAMEYAETYLEANSYGTLDIEFVPVHRWLRARQTAEENLRVHAAHLVETDDSLTAHAAELAGDEIDFSTIDEIMVVFPSSHFSGDLGLGPLEVDGVSLPVSWVNTYPHAHPVPPQLWGGVAAHSVARNLGLLNLYGYQYEPVPDPPPGKIWVSSEWGLMSVNVFFPAPEDHPGITVSFERPDGTTGTEPFSWLPAREMLAWHRWLLGWLDESQIECVTDHRTTVELSPVAEPGPGTAMAAIRLDRNRVLVLESRRELGYDADVEATSVDGSTGTLPRLIEEGVLAYTVDARPLSFRLPVRLAQDPDGTQILDDDPILAVGESVTVGAYTITVTADNGSTHTVSITRNE